MHHQLQQNQKQCAHGACHCAAEAESEYCSTWCLDASGGDAVEGDSCECGHEGCEEDHA